MTEPIIITLIIVAGLVSLAWIALHFGYKAWSAQREDEAVEVAPGERVEFVPGREYILTLNHGAAAVNAEAIRRAAENHLKYALRNA